MVTEAALILPRRLVLRILAAAQNSAPNRMGGVVGHDADGPVAFMQLRNGAPQPETQLVHASGDIQAARFGLDGRGLGLWAYVVSYPASAAEPKAEDFRNSPYPDALHLVISLSTKGVLEMRAWRRLGTEPHECVLKIKD
ncbi:hypothetical protein C3942_11825 [Solimonas fluminis]|uniref:Uncharacterized protein n=1 Tax=Solimonas fluminis TaxID=2086571 RepID=A0A2S5TES3_9GAMM|nr:hypothetical protein [Solimonas fluminis]PPE73490.1 hypothetical protein C3942_11825 [Solimonas fluminis]